MYKFNPISDISLFENIQTQHFYNKEDIKKKRKRMFQYIYWFNDDELVKNKKDNEIFKRDLIKYIVNNIPILEEWCGYKYKEIIYDSFKDGKSSEIFRNKIINHSHLYFIIIDSDNNVFGHYHNGIIDRIGDLIYDSNIFMFTLNSNGRCGIKKFNNKEPDDVFTGIYDDNDFYGCCGGYAIREIDKNKSWVDSEISGYFDIDDPTIFTGSCLPDYFAPKRIVVLQFN